MIVTIQQLKVVNYILLALVIGLVLYMVTDLQGFKKEGDRFTYCDGVYLLEITKEIETGECIGDETKFRTLLK